MKKMIVSTAAFAVVAFSAVALAPTNALANSAFARQTGQACHACHFQSIPRLNAFGSKFRINAFRDTGTQGLIEDEGLSLPASFNAGLNMALGLSYGDTEITGNPNAVNGGGLFDLPPLGTVESNTGIAWPTEAELVIGGRYGDNFGGVTTIGLMRGDSHFANAHHSPGLEHYKLAFVYDTEMGPVAIAGGSTENRGAAYLFNDPSNVFGRNLSGWGHQSVALGLDSSVFDGNSLGAQGIMAGSVTGLGIYTHLNGMGYLAVGGLIPTDVAAGEEVNFKISPYVRAAFTGTVSGFEVVAGGWYFVNKWGDYNAGALNAELGGITFNTASLTNVSTTQYGVDLQVQGNLPGTGATVGFYLPWQIKGESLTAATVTGDQDWTGVYPMFTVAMGPVGGRFGYDYAEIEGKGDQATNWKVKSKSWVLGAWFDVAQNVVVDLEYVNQTIDNYDASGRGLLGIFSPEVGPTQGIETSRDIVTAVVEYVY
ncbi:MAG: hypothetical protein R8K46_06695 [Mariprofundaceae bacterium]